MENATNIFKKMLRDSCQQSPLPAEKSDTTQRKVESTFRITALFKRNEKEARSRVIEKIPPMAAVNLSTDVDAPCGEKMETSRK